MSQIPTDDLFDNIDGQDIIKNCLIYVRVSTQLQVDTGHSLDDQVNRLVKFAQARNYNILEIFREEGKSAGTTTGRPEFTRMLERCDKDSDVNIVLLEERDRAFRNAQDHLAVKAFLKNHNIELIASEEPNFGDDPVGNFVDLVMAGANQLQREITGEKTRRTMIALAENGYQPGRARLGYLNSFKKNKPWKVDKEREYFILEIFRRFNNRISPSVYALEEELYEEGFRTRDGGRVSASTIHTILTDVRYAGKVLYNGKSYPGKHPKIVEMDTINQARSILSEHNRGADRSRKHNFFLAGMTFCKNCNSLMSGEEHVKNSGLIIRYYRCLGKKNRHINCDQPYTPMEDIHTQLEDHISGIKFSDRFLEVLRDELEQVMNSQGKDIPGQIKSLEQRKTAVEKKMDRLEDQMISKTIPKDRVEKKYVPLRDELKTIEGQIAKLKKPSANLDKKKIDTIIHFLRDFPELWRSFNRVEKKQFLRWFVGKIWIKDKGIVEVSHTEAFQSLIDMDLVRIRALWHRLRELNP